MSALLAPRRRVGLFEMEPGGCKQIVNESRADYRSPAESRWLGRAMNRRLVWGGSSVFDAPVFNGVIIGGVEVVFLKDVGTVVKYFSA